MMRREVGLDVRRILERIGLLAEVWWMEGAGGETH